MLKRLALSRAVCLRQLQASLLKVVSKTLPSVSIRSRMICLARLMQNQAFNINPLLAGRKIDQEFLSQLEVTDERQYAMPGAVCKNSGDPRINLSSNVARASDELILAEHLATIRHKSSARVFIVYRDTVDALFL